MRTAEILGGVVVLAVALVAGTQAAGMTYLVEGVPGPGFAPVWAALLMGVCGVGILVEAVRGRAEGRFATGAAAWRVPAMAAAFALVIWLVPYLGMLIACGLVTVVLALLMGERRWGLILAGAAGAVVGVYVVFQYWLQVPFPRGFLGW